MGAGMLKISIKNQTDRKRFSLQKKVQRLAAPFFIWKSFHQSIIPPSLCHSSWPFLGTYDIGFLSRTFKGSMDVRR